MLEISKKILKTEAWEVILLNKLFFANLIYFGVTGFLSISWGAKRNHTDKKNITWVADNNYIDVGEKVDIGDDFQIAYGSYLHTLCFFPKPLKKFCYQFPVNPNVPYLLRIWFSIGNYIGFKYFPRFNISVETPGMLFRSESIRFWVSFLLLFD